MNVFKNFGQGIITLLVGLGVFLVPFFSFAQIDNAVNPFVSVDHSGTAEKIAVVGLNDAGATDGGQGDALVNVVRSVVNRILGILGMIALLVLLYGGFQMVTAAGNEDQYNNGFTILKQAAFGLAMIGVAWFLVSIIFFIIALGTQNSLGTDGNTLTSP